MLDCLHIPYRAWRFRLKGEPECIAYLLRESGLQTRTCLDIGAYKGAFTYWMCRRAERVIAFEPQPELYAYLTRCHRWFRHPRLTVEPLGISAHPGRLALARPSGVSGQAGFHDQGPADMERIEVEVETLDRYVARQRVASVGFIKCDVEGHEEQVFRGGEQLLLRDQPTLLFEGHERIVRDGALFAYLESLGYVGFFFAYRQLHSMRFWPELIGLDNPLMTNYVFVPRHLAATVPVASMAARERMLRHCGLAPRYA